jgi:DNA-binding NtrC family response regulator
VGGGTPTPVDVRLLAATTKDLEAEIANGNFREDLFYHIKVIHIHLPALRDLREEIPLLANHFLREYCSENGGRQLEFSGGVLRKLSSLPWPGNVRQLRNEVTRLAACARGLVIQEEDGCEPAPALARRAGEPAGSSTPEPSRPRSLKSAIGQLEREMIADALRSTRNNQQQAARALGLSRQGLINKIKRYGSSGQL